VKIAHIRRSADFPEIIRKGGKIKESRLTVFFRRHFSPGGLSVGLVVSKKTEPLATGRNYIRRVVYSICDEIAPRFKTKTDIIVRVEARKPFLGRKKLYDRLRKEIYSALGKIKEKTLIDRPENAEE